MSWSSFEPPDRGDRRSFVVAGELWSVSERDAERVPGARAPTCLVFESQGAVRRAWSFPANWRDMDDSALWRLSELTASTSARMDALQRAFITSIIAQNTAGAVIAALRGALEENRALREQRKSIIQLCRAARQESHDIVAEYARQERAAGKSATDVLKNLDATLRKTAFVMNDPQRTARLASDVARWCDEGFQAA